MCRRLSPRLRLLSSLPPGRPDVARIEELDLALAPLLLAVGDDPDVGADAGVVEHLLRQGDDGLEPVVLDDPLADVALARARAAGEERRAAEDDGQARAVLVLRRAHGLELVDHVLQEEQRAVVDARQPGAEAAVEAALVVLLLDLLLLLLPVHAEGRIGEEVVEGLARELVLGEAVAEADVVAAAVVVHLLHQHVGGGGGEGALVVVLPVDVEPAPRRGARAGSSALRPACRRCRRPGRAACARCRAWRAACRRG